jgi:AraC-like DNA-binding protein
MTRPMPKGMTNSQAMEIARQIFRFLQSHHIRRVHFAKGHCSPPQLAFMVRFPRLSLTLAGCDEMQIEQPGTPVTITPKTGEVILVPPSCWNKPSWRRPVKVLHLLFGVKQLGASLIQHDGRSAEPSRAARFTAHSPITPPVRGIVNALMDTHDENMPPAVSTMLATALLYAAMHSLQAPSLTPGRKAHHKFESICLFMQEHVHQPLTRESVAAQFRLNPNHLSRLFRREGSMKFTDYLTWVRIDRAKFLLRRHDLTISEVAAACGFNDPAYFCRVFKQRTQLTPLLYRQTPLRNSLPPAVIRER